LSLSSLRTLTIFTIDTHLLLPPFFHYERDNMQIKLLNLKSTVLKLVSLFNRHASYDDNHNNTLAKNAQEVKVSRSSRA
jgi:hypothetical protein